MEDDLSRLSDHELVELQGGIGDPHFREMVRAEERRRASDKVIIQSKRANWIALGSLTIALVSLVISVVVAFGQ